jgi:hypothetical protein
MQYGIILSARQDSKTQAAAQAWRRAVAKPFVVLKKLNPGTP